jgi:hypothetical protein
LVDKASNCKPTFDEAGEGKKKTTVGLKMDQPAPGFKFTFVSAPSLFRSLPSPFQKDATLEVKPEDDDGGEAGFGGWQLGLTIGGLCLLL